MIRRLCVGIWLGAGTLLAGPISPECMGVQKAAGYDEAKQQAFLQNYYALSFMLTPMGPVVPYDKASGSIGLELGLVPALGCQQRLVLGGTKTENTNLLPVLPRPRIQVQMPKIGPVSLSAGLAFLPPIPTKLGTVASGAGELGIGWHSDFGLSVGARGHFSFARVRAEMATPFKEGDPALDDLLYAFVYGADAGLAYRFKQKGASWLTLFANAGFAAVNTFFCIGDNMHVVQNMKNPYRGATVSGGLRALFFEDHFQIVLEASSAIPVYTTGKISLAYVW